MCAADVSFGLAVRADSLTRAKFLVNTSLLQSLTFLDSLRNNIKSKWNHM